MKRNSSERQKRRKRKEDKKKSRKIRGQKKKRIQQKCSPLLSLSLFSFLLHRSEREILYIPPSAGTHRILIAYSNELLTTFPFEVELPDAHCVLMSQSTHINLESEICVRLSDKRSGQVLSVVSGAVVVSSPSGEKVI